LLSCNCAKILNKSATSLFNADIAEFNGTRYRIEAEFTEPKEPPKKPGFVKAPETGFLV